MYTPIFVYAVDTHLLKNHIFVDYVMPVSVCKDFLVIVVDFVMPVSG